MRKCGSLVSNFAFEETHPAMSEGAAETMCNDDKEFESPLDNWLNTLSEQSQDFKLILQK